jgi:hypothetical protein
MIAGTVSGAGQGDLRRAALRRAERRGPAVDGELTYTVNLRLRSGFTLALRRVHRLEACRELFARLGADGLDTLSFTTYSPAGDGWQREVCASSEAFTTVGGGRVWLCGGFGWLSDEDAAAVLLHEALHSAGLGERPLDPTGPTPDEIDRMVASGCGL